MFLKERPISYWQIFTHYPCDSIKDQGRVEQWEIQVGQSLGVNISQFHAINHQNFALFVAFLNNNNNKLIYSPLFPFVVPCNCFFFYSRCKSCSDCVMAHRFAPRSDELLQLCKSLWFQGFGVHGVREVGERPVLQFKVPSSFWACTCPVCTRMRFFFFFSRATKTWVWKAHIRMQQFGTRCVEF